MRGRRKIIPTGPVTFHGLDGFNFAVIRLRSETTDSMLAFMTEEPLTDTEHNRSFRTHNGYLAAFRYLAFDGRRFGTLDYHLGKLADRSLSVYSDQIKPVKIAVDREAVCGCLYRAWGTETILCTTAELSPDADLLRLALAWGPYKPITHAMALRKPCS